LRLTMQRRCLLNVLEALVLPESGVNESVEVEKVVEM